MSLETLPKYECDTFCKWLFKATEEYFENPEVMKRFEKWKKERRIENDECTD